MTPGSMKAVPAEPFFLRSEGSQLFCLLHRPGGPCRGTILYVHPFGEELNRSRRMAALQARKLAALGFAVLQIDLYGCGDSGGDFVDASWERWHADVGAGVAWLQAEFDQPLSLWGLRLGATLALDFSRRTTQPVSSILLWQPVLNGATYLTQFLRLRLANALLSESAASQTGTSELRAQLNNGEILEIGGYQLSPRLAQALDRLDSIEALAPTCPVNWIEAVGAPAQAAPPGAARAIERWKAKGTSLRVYTVPCPPFWTTNEITVSEEWLEATCDAVRSNQQDA